MIRLPLILSRFFAFAMGRSLSQHATSNRPSWASKTACGWFASLAIVPMTLVGCGANPETLLEVVDKVREVSTANTEVDADLETDLTPTVEPQSKFTPPYPERVNPFLYPEDTSDSPVDTNVSSLAVELLGFANVGTQRVVIRIGGSVYSPAVGQRVGNLDVISIHPPQAEFRNGSFSWTANLHAPPKQ
jgi:hypothetical protein